MSSPLATDNVKNETTMSNSEELLQEFSKRRLALLFDDTAPTQRSVWVRPAENCSPAEVNEILELRGSLLCVAVSSSRAQGFMLSPMARPRSGSLLDRSLDHGDESYGSNMCESVEAREGVTTGISAFDRALTISILGERNPTPRKLVRPGHIFPVAARDGGILVRQALTEGALDLVRLSGHSDAAVFVDSLGPNGEFLRPDDQISICHQLGAPRLALSTLTRLRLVSEKLIYRVAEARLPTRLAGDVHAVVYKSHIHSGEHVALIKGRIDSTAPTLIRVQPEFTFSDVFGGNTPPSRRKLLSCLKLIGEQGSGVLLYLRRPVSGQLQAQIRSWHSTYHEKPAVMMREYGLGAQILRDLGVRKAHVITDSTKNLVGLTSFGIEIVGQTTVPSCPLPQLSEDDNFPAFSSIE